METNGGREFEASFRLQQLAKYTKLSDRVKGVTRVGRLPFLNLLGGLGTVVAVLLTHTQPPLVVVGTVGLVALLSAALKEINNRVDALVALLELADVLGPDLRRNDRSA